jgi:acetolactate decarboxylase
MLDGELVMVDGKLYKIEADGTVVQPADSIKIVYANAAFSNPQYQFEIDDIENFDALLTAVEEELPNQNLFYSFKISGDFDYVKCGGLHEQERPFKEGLDVLIPNRPTFERESFSGTIVGFYCPKFIGNINVSGFHFHFMSKDEEFGGHLMELQANNLVVEVTPISKYSFDLPTTTDFYDVGFDKEFQYSSD